MGRLFAAAIRIATPPSEGVVAGRNGYTPAVTAGCCCSAGAVMPISSNRIAIRGGNRPGDLLATAIVRIVFEMQWSLTSAIRGTFNTLRRSTSARNLACINEESNGSVR